MSPVPHPEDERERPSNEQMEEEIENADYPDVIINAGSSDSEDDEEVDEEVDGSYMGYQALAQTVEQPDTSDEDEADDPLPPPEPPSYSGEDVAGQVQVPEGLVHQVRQPDFPNISNLPHYMQVPDVPRPDKKDLLWNQPQASDLNLDRGQMEKIKSVMSGIQLPSTNIPDWAKCLSDDQWQAQVVSRLVDRDGQCGQKVGQSENQVCQTGSGAPVVQTSHCEGSQTNITQPVTSGSDKTDK